MTPPRATHLHDSTSFEWTILDRLDRHEAAISRRLDDQDDMLGEIRKQAELTNSRVGKLELWKARAEGFRAAFHWVQGVVIAAIGAGAGTLVTVLLHH